MNKIIGYFLLCLGLILIFFAAVSMFKVFTGAQQPVQLVSQFHFDVTTQAAGAVKVDAPKIIPLVNLALHAMFMMFIAMAGGRVCGAGINMVKLDIIAEKLSKAKIEDVKKL